MTDSRDLMAEGGPIDQLLTIRLRGLKLLELTLQISRFRRPYRLGSQLRFPVAATMAINGPVLITMSSIVGFACKFISIPLNCRYAYFAKRFKESVAIHRHQLSRLAGRNSPQLEELRRHGKTHGFFELAPRQTSAIWQGFGVVQCQRVHFNFEIL